MDLRKIGLGLVSLALGVAGMLVKQALAVSLDNHDKWNSIQSLVDKPLGVTGIFFLITWIVGIWLIISGFRSKTVA